MAMCRHGYNLPMTASGRDLRSTSQLPGGVLGRQAPYSLPIIVSSRLAKLRRYLETFGRRDLANQVGSADWTGAKYLTLGERNDARRDWVSVGRWTSNSSSGVAVAQ
jgi:hypothetical protein